MAQAKVSEIFNNSILHAITPEIREEIKNIYADIMKFDKNVKNQGKVRVKRPFEENYELLKTLFSNYYGLKDLKWNQFMGILSKFNDLDSQILLGPVLREFMAKKNPRNSQHFSQINARTGWYDDLTPEEISKDAAQHLGFGLRTIIPVPTAEKQNFTNKPDEPVAPIKTITLYHKQSQANFINSAVKSSSRWERVEDETNEDFVSKLKDDEQTSQFRKLTPLWRNPATTQFGLEALRKLLSITVKTLSDVKYDFFMPTAEIYQSLNQVQYIVSNYNISGKKIADDKNHIISLLQPNIYKEVNDFINNFVGNKVPMAGTKLRITVDEDYKELSEFWEAAWKRSISKDGRNLRFVPPFYIDKNLEKYFQLCNMAVKNNTAEKNGWKAFRYVNPKYFIQNRGIYTGLANIAVKANPEAIQFLNTVAIQSLSSTEEYIKICKVAIKYEEALTYIDAETILKFTVMKDGKVHPIGYDNYKEIVIEALTHYGMALGRVNSQFRDQLLRNKDWGFYEKMVLTAVNNNRDALEFIKWNEDIRNFPAENQKKIVLGVLEKNGLALKQINALFVHPYPLSKLQDKESFYYKAVEKALVNDLKAYEFIQWPLLGANEEKIRKLYKLLERFANLEGVSLQNIDLSGVDQENIEYFMPIFKKILENHGLDLRYITKEIYDLLGKERYIELVEIAALQSPNSFNHVLPVFKDAEPDLYKNVVLNIVKKGGKIGRAIDKKLYKENRADYDLLTKTIIEALKKESSHPIYSSFDKFSSYIESMPAKKYFKFHLELIKYYPYLTERFNYTGGGVYNYILDKKDGQDTFIKDVQVWLVGEKASPESKTKIDQILKTLDYIKGEREKNILTFERHLLRFKNFDFSFDLSENTGTIAEQKSKFFQAFNRLKEDPELRESFNNLPKTEAASLLSKEFNSSLTNIENKIENDADRAVNDVKKKQEAAFKTLETYKNELSAFTFKFVEPPLSVTAVEDELETFKKDLHKLFDVETRPEVKSALNIQKEEGSILNVIRAKKTTELETYAQKLKEEIIEKIASAQNKYDSGLKNITDFSITFSLPETFSKATDVITEEEQLITTLNNIALDTQLRDARKLLNITNNDMDTALETKTNEIRRRGFLLKQTVERNIAEKEKEKLMQEELKRTKALEIQSTFLKKLKDFDITIEPQATLNEVQAKKIKLKDGIKNLIDERNNLKDQLKGLEIPDSEVKAFEEASNVILNTTESTLDLNYSHHVQKLQAKTDAEKRQIEEARLKAEAEAREKEEARLKAEMEKYKAEYSTGLKNISDFSITFSPENHFKSTDEVDLEKADKLKSLQSVAQDSKLEHARAYLKLPKDELETALKTKQTELEKTAFEIRGTVVRRLQEEEKLKLEAEAKAKQEAEARKAAQKNANAQKVLDDSLKKITQFEVVFSDPKDSKNPNDFEKQEDDLIQKLTTISIALENLGIAKEVKILEALTKKETEIRSTANKFKTEVEQRLNREEEDAKAKQQDKQNAKDTVRSVLDKIKNITVDFTNFKTEDEVKTHRDESISSLALYNKDSALESALVTLGGDERKSIEDTINAKTEELNQNADNVLKNLQLGANNLKAPVSTPTGEPTSPSVSTPTGEPASPGVSTPTGQPTSPGVSTPTGQPTKENIVPTLKIHQEYNEVLKLLYNKAKEFKKDRPKTDEIKLAYDSVKKLHKKLLSAGNDFFTGNLNTIELVKFQTLTHNLIENATKKGKLNEHRAIWKPILMHILAFIGTGGVGYIAAVLIDYAVHKRSTFFATDTTNINEDIKNKVDQTNIDDRTGVPTPKK